MTCTTMGTGTTSASYSGCAPPSPGGPAAVPTGAAGRAPAPAGGHVIATELTGAPGTVATFSGTDTHAHRKSDLDPSAAEGRMGPLARRPADPERNASAEAAAVRDGAGPAAARPPCRTASTTGTSCVAGSPDPARRLF